MPSFEFANKSDIFVVKSCAFAQLSYECVCRSGHIGSNRAKARPQEKSMFQRHPPAPSQIAVSEDVKLKLLSASIDTGFEKEDWEIAAEAVDEWLRRHDPHTIPMPVTNGYQWKSLFLPDGTFLRTVFGGKNHHCRVENDRIMYNGQGVSPSGFVNAVGGVRRNAWRSTWVLLPDAPQWQLADTLRSRPRPPRVRKPVRAIEQAPATQPHTQPSTQPSTQPRTQPRTQPPNQPPNQSAIDLAAAAAAPAQPILTPGNPIAALVAREQRLPSCSDDRTRRSCPDNEGGGRHQHAGATLAPPGCRRHDDRRRGGDGRRKHGPTSSA